MVRFSKGRFRFRIIGVIFVLIFIVGAVGLLAQTTQDSLIDKDRPSSNTTKKDGLFGSSISLLGWFTIGGTIVGIISLVINLIRRKQPSIQVVLITSEDISKFINDKQSNESSRVEKVVQSIERNPKASFVDKTIADAYRLQQDGRIDEAIQVWSGIAKDAEGNDDKLAARAWFSIGHLYTNGRATEERLSANDIAIQLQSDSSEVYIDPETMTEAVLNYSKAIRLNPDYVEAYVKRGKLNLFQRNYELAIDDYTEVIRLKPDYVEAYGNRGFAKTEIENYESAIEDYNEIIRLMPCSAKAYNGRGLAQGRMGEYESAIDDYTEAIKLKPDFAEAYSNRGRTRAELGAYESAIEDFDEAIRLKPDFVGTYSNRGNAKLELGAYESAIDDYTEAIKLKPDFAEAYDMRGNVKSFLGEYESAFDDYTEAIRLKPDFAQAYNGRGVAKANLEHPELAIADYDEAIRLRTNFAEAYGNRGNTKIALEDIEGAQKDLHTALELAEQQGKEDIKVFVEQWLQNLLSRK